MDDVLFEEIEPGIVLLTLNRPERRNALSSQLLAALHASVDRIAGDPAIRVVILTGGGAGFCSGADMKSDGDMTGTGGTPMGDLLSRVQGSVTRTFAAQEMMASLFERVHRLRQPVIAAVHGAAVGGGFAFALACDIRFAAPRCAVRRGVHQAGSVGVRHGHELPAASAGRRVARGRADADRPHVRRG